MLKTGLVIGTYGSVPYIHLSLESRKKHYPNIPILVSDDCSPSQTQLKELCTTYGADFISNNSHMPDHYGDLSAFVHGFRWAKENNISLLMKISRRFIPLFDWSLVLNTSFLETDGATFSNSCSTYGFGFRTECTAFHVPTWYRLGLVAEMETKLAARNGGLFMESYMHELAKKTMLDTSTKASEWLYKNVASKECEGYIPLDFMGTSRVKKKENLLWHDYTHPLQYWSKAYEWGIYKYKDVDFINPNR